MERWIEETHGEIFEALWDERAVSELFIRVIEPIDREVTPLSELNVIGKITFGGELHIRSENEKAGYKGPLFKAMPGDLVISKIRVAQGSFCIVPPEVDHLAVSPEYPVYRLQSDLVDGEFVRMVMRTAEFRRRVSLLKAGNTTKGRIRPEEFESLTIPTPPPPEQQALVAAWQTAVREAERLEAEANTAETDARREFEAALGITAPKSLPARPVFVARFRDIERWSHEGMLRATLNHDQPPASPWPMVRLGDIGKVSYGIQKCPANRPGTHARPYLRVANVQRGYLDLREIKEINVPDTDMALYRLKIGDILLCEGNSADLVGRGTVWNGEIPDCVHQNHVLRVRLKPGHAQPEFVLAAINSGFGQAYFRSKAKRTTNLASINSKEVADFILPLPSLDEQKHLVQRLNHAGESAQNRRRQAERQRQSAWQAFEAALFAAPNEVSE